MTSINTKCFAEPIMFFLDIFSININGNSDILEKTDVNMT